MLALRLCRSKRDVTELEGYHSLSCPECSYGNEYFSLSPTQCLCCYALLPYADTLLGSAFARLSFHYGYNRRNGTCKL